MSLWYIYILNRGLKMRKRKMFEIMLSGRGKGIEVGLIGEWRVESNKLPLGTNYAQAVQTESRVYLLGGKGKTLNGVDVIHSAPIVDGVIGSWVTEPNKLHTPLWGSQVIQIESRVYLLGGYNGSETSSIFSAPIVDGLIGEWVIESNKIPVPLYESQVIKVGTRVYLISGGGGQSSVYSAPIVDGLIGAWVTESNTLPGSVYSSNIIQVESKVYLMGGRSGLNGTNLVYSAPIVDGVIGAWSTEPNKLPDLLQSAQAIRTETRVYILGGYGIGNKIFSAPIVDGLIGAWTTESNKLPGSVYYSQAVQTESMVYLLGGNAGSDFIYSARLK